MLLCTAKYNCSKIRMADAAMVKLNDDWPNGYSIEISIPLV